MKTLYLLLVFILYLFLYFIFFKRRGRDLLIISIQCFSMFNNNGHAQMNLFSNNLIPDYKSVYDRNVRT